MGVALKLKLLCVLLLSLSLESYARPNARQRVRRGVSPRSNRTGSVHARLLKGAGCTLPSPAEIEAPRANIWGRLTREETHGLEKWLIAQEELNLTHSFRDWHNYVSDYDLIQPNKSDVLAYLDGTAPAPIRYAQVTLANLATETPNFSHIMVGPLPLSSETTWQPLDYLFTRKTPIRYLQAAGNYRAEEKFVKNITEPIDDITLKLFNATAYGRNSTIYPYGGGSYPTLQYNDRITEWGEYSGLGLYFGMDMDLFGRDPDSWKFKGWVYNNIFYRTTEEFREAVFSPGFEILPVNIDGDNHWYSTDHSGPVLPLDDKAPPMPVAGKQARFSIDYNGQS